MYSKLYISYSTYYLHMDGPLKCYVKEGGGEIVCSLYNCDVASSQVFGRLLCLCATFLQGSGMAAMGEWRDERWCSKFTSAVG